MGKMIVENWSNNPCDYVSCPIAAATQVKQGDLISLESNKATVLATVTDDATMLGLAFTESTSTESDDITVCTGPVVVMSDVTSATYGLGAGLKYSAGDFSTAWSFVADGSANTIGWSYQEKTSAVTRLRILFDTRSLGKLFAVSA